MRKALCHARIYHHDPAHPGIVKKYLGQVAGFPQLGVDSDLAWYGEEDVFLNERLISHFQLSQNSGAWRNILFHHLWFDAAIARQLILGSMIFCSFAIRRSIRAFCFLKKARKANVLASLCLPGLMGL